jgi:hypothetical protein
VGSGKTFTYWTSLSLMDCVGQSEAVKTVVVNDNTVSPMDLARGNLSHSEETGLVMVLVDVTVNMLPEQVFSFILLQECHSSVFVPTIYLLYVYSSWIESVIRFFQYEIHCERQELEEENELRGAVWVTNGVIDGETEDLTVTVVWLIVSVEELSVFH